MQRLRIIHTRPSNNRAATVAISCIIYSRGIRVDWWRRRARDRFSRGWLDRDISGTIQAEAEAARPTLDGVAPVLFCTRRTMLFGENPPRCVQGLRVRDRTFRVNGSERSGRRCRRQSDSPYPSRNCL